MLGKSLCGKSPCPGLCARVEHCPAGQDRVQWLWLVRRGERGQLSRRPLLPQLHRPKSQRPRKLFKTHGTEQSKPPYTRNLRVLASPVTLLVILLFIGLVVGIGLALNGGDFAPGYEPPSTPAYNEWR